MMPVSSEGVRETRKMGLIVIRGIISYLPVDGREKENALNEGTGIIEY